MQTIDHRREHRVGRRKIAEEEGASLTKLPAGLPKSLFEAGDIGACLGGQLPLFDLAAHIHRQQPAHAHEARMHFGGERTGLRPRRLRPRPYWHAWMEFGDIFDNRERIPYDDFAIV